MTKRAEGHGLWAVLKRWLTALGPQAARPVRAAQEIDSHLAASLPAECVSTIVRSRRQ